MIVCVCHSITDKQILDAAREGAQSLADVQAMTGCATSCGSCSDMATEIVMKFKSQQLSSNFIKVYSEPVLAVSN